MESEYWKSFSAGYPGTLMIVGPDGRIRHINRVFEEYAGVEVVGTDCFAYMEEPYSSRQKALFESIMAGGPAGSIEIRYVRESGEVVWFRSQLSPLIEGNQVTGVVIFGQDVTREKETETALRLSEAKYRRIVHTAKDGIWVIDGNGVTTFANPRMAEMLGYTPEEMLGRVFLDFMKPDTRPQGVRNLEKRLAGIGEEHESTLVHRNGSFVLTIMQTSPIGDEHGKITGALAVVHDITAQRRAEEERRQVERKMLEAQKLESLGVLAGGIAHDFNNMLGAILGNVSLARLSEPGSPDADAAMITIEKIAKRSAELTRQLLAYTGRGRLSREPVELGSLVREMIDLLRVSVGKQVLFELDLSAKPLHVEGDATQLRQVVMNLITNASEAIGARQGTIRLRTSAVQVSDPAAAGGRFGGPLAAGTYAVVEVEDTGCGIDPASVDRIFDPFYTTKFTGRGLGLAAVLGIVRNHKGSLDVRTEPGRGTTFRIFLPHATGVESAKPPPGYRISGRNGSHRVLVIDDEPMVRQTTGQMLAMAGYQVIEAEGGHPAIEILSLKDTLPDLILLDLTMPGWDGVRTMTEIRNLGHRDVPVVVMTGYAEADVLHRFAGIPPAAILQKPFSYEELVEQLERVIASGNQAAV